MDLTCTEHVLGYRVVIINLFAVLILNNGHLCLVEVLCPRVICILPLAPTDYSALCANGQSLVLMRKTCESYIRRRDDLFW